MQIEHRMDAKRGNLIWLSDGRTEAAAALDFGIRIVHLSCAGKPNLFYSQPDDLSDINSTEEEINATAKHIREVIAGL